MPKYRVKIYRDTVMRSEAWIDVAAEDEHRARLLAQDAPYNPEKDIEWSDEGMDDV
jgi:hypothetical protein